MSKQIQNKSIGEVELIKREIAEEKQQKKDEILSKYVYTPRDIILNAVILGTATGVFLFIVIFLAKLAWI